MDNLGPAGAGIKRRYFFSGGMKELLTRVCATHTLPHLSTYHLLHYAMVLRSKEGRAAHSSVIETLKLCRKLKKKNLNLGNDEHLSA